MKARDHRALVVILALVTGVIAIAQNEPENEDDNEARTKPTLQDIPAEQFEKSLIESDLSLPTPAELFDALAKQTNIRWRSYYRDPLTHTLANRSNTAVWLGARLADTYLAMEARDTQQVRNLSKDIQAHARNLGMGEKTEARIIRLDAFAGEQAWTGARFEVESLQSELAINLRAMRDKDLAEMILIGVWLRTLEITTLVVNAEEFEDMVVCVGGIGMVDQLLDRLEKLGPGLQKDPIIGAAKSQLERVSRIWKGEKVLSGRQYGDDEVKETHTRISTVLNYFVRKP